MALPTWAARHFRAPDFGKLVADETEKWGKFVEFAGLKPE
jgi:hypothetical protein